MDILNNVQKAVKNTIKTLETAGGGVNSIKISKPPIDIVSHDKKLIKAKSPRKLGHCQRLTDKWRPAKVQGAIYGNRILHFKDPIPTTGRPTERTDEWILQHFFNTGEAICRFCFRVASSADGIVFVVNMIYVAMVT